MVSMCDSGTSTPTTPMWLNKKNTSDVFCLVLFRPERHLCGQLRCHHGGVSFKETRSCSNSCSCFTCITKLPAKICQREWLTLYKQAFCSIPEQQTLIKSPTLNFPQFNRIYFAKLKQLTRSWSKVGMNTFTFHRHNHKDLFRFTLSHWPLCKLHEVIDDRLM